MNIKLVLKSILPHILAVLAMVIVSSVYFYPAWEGKTLQGEDIIGGFGKNREKVDFQKYEDETVIWNGTIFSGMPDYVQAKYEGATSLEKVFYLPFKKSGFGLPREVASIFWYMLGFYILLVAVGIPPMLSSGGAMAFAISSYNLIIILAGHYMKVYTLALIPPTLAGIILIFNGKYRWGLILTSFFLAMQITMAHIQMMYYFLISMLVLGLVEMVYQIREKTFKKFLKTVAILFAAAILGIAPNYARLLNYYLYNDYSIRGSSELSIGNEDVKTNKGLDKDYINMWSSGVDEAMMIIAPNVKGGMTSAISQNRDLLNNVPRQLRQTIGSFNQYWGNQPFSGGPNYLGIVFVFLFLLGVFLIKDRLKTAILITVILFLLLAMGGNLSFFTDLWIDYFPLYNKFRTPVSILALSAILLSFFALYSTYQISSNDELLNKKASILGMKNKKPIYLLVSAGVVIFLLLNIVFPNLFNSYLSNSEQNQISQWLNQPNAGNQVDQIINELVALRVSVFRADLWRALIFVVLLTISLYLLAHKKVSKQLFWGIVVTLALVDFWGIGRRYVGIDQFHKKSLVKEMYALSENDRQIYQEEINEHPIIQDKLNEYDAKFNPKNQEEKDAILTHVVNKFANYRVFNLTGSPFQENITSNAHKSIGGYHPVKLRRYQDMIEQHISKMHQPVLNMLNTKYLITQNGVQSNPGILGSAWFVDSIKWVDNPNDEILDLNNINIKSTAIVRTENKDKLPALKNSIVSGTISLDDYSPDKMEYTSMSDKEGLAVFSEIFYPDWKVFIDGKEGIIVPVNYVLRGVPIPKGDHKIEFIFHPGHYYNANIFSRYSFYFLILVLLFFLGLDVFNKMRKHTT